ncbi:hypothetical protein CAEBREN_15772 [Caenorhabditis brenneri]|uniref:T20D4.11-like domain-containing protein n=1 Tax=Caenorhabditis brenneri TaxID=135651 RepID=G0MA04_CAEBE|nr:hypothetical protein CAEBREN_15772 [Caenorhabditis brenneri]
MPTSPAPSCAMAVIAPKISKCLDTLNEMMKMIEFAKSFNENQKSKYLDDCDFFLSCQPEFECINDPNLGVAFRSVEVQCKSAKFIIREFAECDKKLTNLNSTCSQTYNPFPEIKEKDVPSMLKEGRKDPCEKLFGESDCMIKEIREECGDKDVVKYRKMQMELAHSLRLCEFHKST